MAVERIDDIVVHWRADGDAAAPTLVLANSLGTDLRLWDPVAPMLGERFRLIRYDLRGHGLTDASEGDTTIRRLGDDLAALMDRVAGGPAVIVGLSIGGLIAQQLALARPDLVRGLVLMATAARIGDADAWQTRIDTVRSGGMTPLVDAVMQRWFTPAFHRERADELAVWRNMLARTAPAGYASCCAALRDADLREAVRGIAVPTLCVAADGDLATPPELVADLAEHIPGARFVTVAASGHLPCVEQPAATAGLVTRFVEESGLG